MHSKIINPAKHGKVVYSNKGSCSRAVNYLSHEAKDEKKEVQFFSYREDNISRNQVIRTIDNNVQGLRKDDTKFVSAVISPSHKELEHLKDDHQKLKQFARACMENYCATYNASLKDDKARLSPETLHPFFSRSLSGDIIFSSGKHKGQAVEPDLHKDYLTKLSKHFKPSSKAALFDKNIKDLLEGNEIGKRNFISGKTAAQKAITPDDLVWFATIHHDRTYKIKDAEVNKGGDAPKVGDTKEGLNTHIHFLISKRDKEMKRTISTEGNRCSFKRKDWQVENGNTFSKLFSYDQKVNYHQTKDQVRTEKTIDRINTDFCLGKEYNNGLEDYKLDIDRVKAIGEKMDYNYLFFDNIYALEKQMERGKFYNDPYQIIANGLPLERKTKSFDTKQATHILNNITSLLKKTSKHLDVDSREPLEELLRKQRRRKNKGKKL